MDKHVQAQMLSNPNNKTMESNENKIDAKASNWGFGVAKNLIKDKLKKSIASKMGYVQPDGADGQPATRSDDNQQTE